MSVNNYVCKERPFLTISEFFMREKYAYYVESIQLHENRDKRLML